MTFPHVELPPQRLLDPALIRSRRLSLGISEKDLATHLGVSVSAVCGIESGADQRNHDVAFVVGLADALSAPVSSLLVVPEAPAVDRTGDLVPDLGALLASADAPVPVGAVCEALRCGLAELFQAARDLTVRLDGTGTVLHQFDGRMSLQAAVVADREALQVATRAALGRTNVGVDRLRLVRELCDRSAQVDPRFSDPWVGRQLVNAGMIEQTVDPSGARETRLTADVRFSLMFDEANEQ